jgi:predicted nucleotidyltransferase component of viral defense system
MHEAIARMLAGYECHRLEDFVRALREILQEVALLGLWRSKFFERAAFYGGTALRILYGLDRFSEDLDFSLLEPMEDFDLSKYNNAMQKELTAFGFEVRVDEAAAAGKSPIRSTFLKADTLKQILVIQADQDIIEQVPRGQILKIKIEVDTDPPPGFDTHTRYLLNPIPFSVRTYVLPDLFAGKMHAVLCRKWKMRVKGRDWYDMVWYVANHPQLNLSHLEQRMRQSEDWTEEGNLTPEAFLDLLRKAVEAVNIKQARREVEPFIKHPGSLTIWSKEFFLDVASRIELITDGREKEAKESS